MVTRIVVGFLLLLDWSIRISLAVEYGPSLNFLISNNRNTQVTPRKEIYLESFAPSYSVVLPLANGSISAAVLNVHPQGDFVVHAPEDHGIMVVIQSLSLRTSVFVQEISDATFLQCRDFIKFQSGNLTSRVCGKVMKASKEGNPFGLLGSRTFITPERQLVVSLSVDDQMPDHDYGWHEYITAELVITAFKECPKTSFISQWMKWTGSSETKSCSPSEDRICIASSSFCDGVANCAVRGPLGHIGFDEQNCRPYVSAGFPFAGPPQQEISKPQTTPKPIFTSSTHRPAYIGVNTPYSPPTVGKFISPIHLILTFSAIVLVIFGTCTWLAKANEKKFQHTMYRFSTMRRRRNPNRQRGTSGGGTNLSDSAGTLSSARIPTAPPPSNTNSIGVSPTSEIPGEEPPPYTELFPSAPPLPMSSK